MIDIAGLREDKRPQSSTIVHALLDRLEAAEKERDALRADLEKERKEHGYTLHAAEAEAKQVDRLRSKIKAMEKQKPDVWMQSTHLSSFKNRLCGSQSSYVHCSDHQLHPDFQPLYALPGAQPAPSVPDHKTIKDLLNKSGLCAYDREGDLAFMVAATKFAALAAAPESSRAD